MDTGALTASKIIYSTPNYAIQGAFCADGTALSACIPSLYSNSNRGQNAVYDVATGKWLANEYDTSGRIVSFSGDGSGTLSTLVTVPHSILNFDINRPAGLATNVVYYCATNGLLYKYDLNSSTESLLPLPVSGMACTGSVEYSSARGSLIFVYSENGLTAGAEYLNP
jgi:hypothetical protein